MEIDSKNDFKLDDAGLNTIWYWSWLTPMLTVVIWLSAIFYGVAFILANFAAAREYENLTSRSKYLAHSVSWHSLNYGLTPLSLAFIVTMIGGACGYMWLQVVESQTQKALRFDFLDEKHPLTLRVHAMAETLGIPKPRVGYMNQVNAFAVGTDRNQAAVILGNPLIKGLKHDELDAVIGHELGHIATGDMTRMVFSEGFQKMFSYITVVIGALLEIALMALAKSGRLDRGSANFGMMLGGLGRYTVGLGGEVVVKGISRKREYYADAIGASLSSPDAMARALKRLGSLSTKSTPAEDKFAYLMFRGSGGDLMSTHPTTESRVEALQSGAYLAKMRRAKARNDALQAKSLELGVAAKGHALAALERGRSEVSRRIADSRGADRKSE